MVTSYANESGRQSSMRERRKVRTHLPSSRCELGLHFLRCRKVSAVPDEVLVFGSVLNVEPLDVHWNVGFVHARLHAEYVRFVDIIPSALVVGSRKVLRKGSASGESRELLEDVLGRGPEEDEDVESARLGHPVRLCRLGGRSTISFRNFLRLLECRERGLGRGAFRDVDPHLGSGRDEDSDGRSRAMSFHEWNGAVLFDWEQQSG